MSLPDPFAELAEEMLRPADLFELLVQLHAIQGAAGI